MIAASTGQTRPVFLSAEWRDLLMLNYRVDPALLLPHLPPGTSLDSFEGTTYISLVAFRFCRTKLLGRIAVPYHSNFLEINLRFYVRRQVADENRRGVVFIAEVVPRRAIAAIARLLYGENYTACRMKHRIETLEMGRTLEFHWRFRNRWCSVSAQTAGVPVLPKPGSLEQFITEHYWGYSHRSGRSLEYRVEHVPWRVWSAASARFTGDASPLYGTEFATLLQGEPDSAFVADGSPVIVFQGNELAERCP